ncbi:MAG: chemotaxis protein CheB, partial [Proteobacteria bacterium]
IVQHISSSFTLSLAKRLDASCKISVSEAVDGEPLKPSHAFLAPGGKQMSIVRRPGQLCIEINDDPPMGRHKPSVDYLFLSAVPVCEKMRVSAAILTGMGSDGAQGLKLLRDAGAHTIAQDEQTSVVYGMPAVAASLEAASQILPIQDITEALVHSRSYKKVA